MSEMPPWGDPQIPDSLPVDVTFDLDTVQRPKEDVAREPFRVNVGGRVITMTDPAELDWQDLAALGDNPIGFLRYAMSDEDRIHFREQRVPSWKLTALMERYMAHYKVDEQIERQRRGHAI